MLQAKIVSHHRLDLLQDCASDSSSYTTLSCTSPKPSTDSPTVSPGLTNLVATMLPVMTIIPWVKLLPCWASMLTNQQQGFHRVPHDVTPIPFADHCAVDEHHTASGRQIDMAPIPERRTQDDPGIPGVVGDQGENVRRELCIVSLPIIHQLEGRYDGGHGIADLIPAIRRLRSGKVLPQLHGDLAFDAQTHIISRVR